MKRFVWAMLWRETRASWTRLLVFVLSISAGVGGLVAVWSFSSGLKAAIRVEARSLMAADLTLSSHRPFTESESAALEGLRRQGAELAYNFAFAAMALAPGDGQAHLVQVRAVDASYPFYGTVELRSGKDFRSLLRDDTVLVHPSLLTRYGLEVGGDLRIGRGTFRIAGVIQREPDRPVQVLALGPQVMLTAKGGAATGLILPTSRVHHEALVKLPEGTDAPAVAEELKAGLPERYARIRAYDEAQPRVRRFLDRLTDYLNLVGLTALILGGIGVAGAMRAFLGQRLDTLAILKCLGASSRELFAIYLLQAGLLGLVGSVAGVVLGLSVQGILVGMLAEFLPVSYGWSYSAPAVLGGIGLGVLTTMWFVVPTLWQMRRVPPARVFRRQVEPRSDLRSRLSNSAITLGSALALVTALVLWQVGFGRTAAIALGGLAGTFIVLQLSAWGLLRLLRWLPKPAAFSLRHGLASLYRPGNQTAAVVVSLGLGVLLVLAVYLIQSDLLRQVVSKPRAQQPNLFFIDIQKHQRRQFAAIVTENSAEALEMIPVVRGRLRALDGIRIRRGGSDDPELQRILAFEYAFTYRAGLVDGEHILKGAFARRPGLPGAQVSVAEWWADATGLGPGNTLTLDIQGVPVRATITSVRRVDWANRRANFSFVFLPGALEDAPQMFVAAVRAEGAERQARLQSRVVASLPNVSVIDVAAIFQAIQQIVDQIGGVIQFMAGFSIAVGLVILLGTVGTTKYDRTREAVLFKTLGATRRAVAQVLATEYLLLGLLAGLVGALAAGALSWGLVTFVFDGQWELSPMPYLAAWGLTALSITLAGLAGTADILMKKPLQVLREE